MFRNWSMGKRILVIVLSVTLISILSLTGASLKTLTDVSLLNSKSSLETNLAQLIGKLNQEYQALLQLSEHMMPHGTIGEIMQDYLLARDTYDRGEYKRALSKAFVTNGGLSSQVIMYHDPSGADGQISNYIIDEQSLQAVHENKVFSNIYLEFHAIHPTFYRFSSHAVVSIAREAEFLDNRRLVVYVEQLSQVPKMLDLAAEAAGTPYILLQTDGEGRVRYSSHPDLFALGQILTAQEAAFGRLGGYYVARGTLSFDVDCLLLTPASPFTGPVINWVKRAVLIGALVGAVVLLATYLLYRHVFRGLGIFKEEIDRVLNEDLGPVKRTAKIRELDELLAQFDKMKSGIKQSIAQMAEYEKKQSKREKELLMYQINPHFLLNTLNSLHWLALMKNQGELSGYVTNLNQILSYNLGKSVPNPTLRDELRFLMLYLGIEQMRHDFTVDNLVEEGSHLDLGTPRLILQPIVENAIGHGLNEGGRLEIQVGPAPDGKTVLIRIRDNGCGIPENRLEDIRRGEQSGLGLKYVFAALEAHYQGRARLLIENMAGGGTQVTLELPLQGEGLP